MLTNYQMAILNALSEEYEAMIPDIVEEHIFSARFEKKMHKLINRRKKPYYKLISTGARRAACIIAAVLVLSASALSVRAVREAVYRFITRIFSGHTRVAVDREHIPEYPDTIENEYYIEDIPEDFELVIYESNNHSVFSIYEKDSDYIFFNQYTKNIFSTDFDNEHSEQETIKLDGQEYTIFLIDNDHVVVWDNGEYILYVKSNLDKNIIVDLCKSTKKK